MKKIELDVGALRVESFETAGGGAGENGAGEREGAPGGVFGLHPSEDTNCPFSHYPCDETDWDWYTCGVSCQAACFPSDYPPDCAS